MSRALFNEYKKARMGGPGPELVEPVNISTSKTLNKDLLQRTFKKNASGENAAWRARAKAEYGKTQEPVMDQRALIANVDRIQSTTSTPNIESFLDSNFVQQSIENSPSQDNLTKIAVNKKGWADVNKYRESDNESVLNTQNFLADKGFDIESDGIWGKQTYNTINEYLVNKQLDNYENTNFTEDQFLSQIYKESVGDNSKISDEGAMGIAQFKPATFKELKDQGFLPETAKITDNAASTLAQRRYMDRLYEGKVTNSNNISSASTKEERQARAFAAYNWGPTNFDEFWDTLTKKEKSEGWRTWFTKTNSETEKYVLWMMDKDKFKAERSTPYRHKKGYMTSEWNDVNYGYEKWKASNPLYRY